MNHKPYTVLGGPLARGTLFHRAAAEHRHLPDWVDIWHRKRHSLLERERLGDEARRGRLGKQPRLDLAEERAIDNGAIDSTQR